MGQTRYSHLLTQPFRRQPFNTANKSKMIIPYILAAIAGTYFFPKIDPRKPKGYDCNTDSEFCVVVAQLSTKKPEKGDEKAEEMSLRKLDGIDRPPAVLSRGVDGKRSLVYFIPYHDRAKVPELGAIVSDGPLTMRVESTACRWYRRGKRSYEPLKAPNNIKKLVRKTLQLT